LSFNEHVRYVTAICAQRVYFLKRLRDQGLPVNQLHIVFESLIVNRIRYAIPAWGGFVTAELRGTVLNVNLKSCKHTIDETLMSEEKQCLSCAYYMSVNGVR